MAAVDSACLEHGSLRTMFSTDDAVFDRHGLRPWLNFFLALHDLGKFASSFQGLQPDIVEALRRPACEQAYSIRRDTLGFFFWNKGFQQTLKNSDEPEHRTLATNNWRKLGPLALVVFNVPAGYVEGDPHMRGKNRQEQGNGCENVRVPRMRGDEPSVKHYRDSVWKKRVLRRLMYNMTLECCGLRNTS